MESTFPTALMRVKMGVHFVPAAQRDRNAEVRDRVEIIHRAVDRIDDPLPLARLISRDALLAKDRVIGKRTEQDFRDERLRAHVEIELDVVRREFIHIKRLSKVAAEQFTRGASGGEGGVEVGGHGIFARETGAKEMGGEINFSSHSLS